MMCDVSLFCSLLSILFYKIYPLITIWFTVRLQYSVYFIEALALAHYLNRLR